MIRDFHRLSGRIADDARGASFLPVSLLRMCALLFLVACALVPAVDAGAQTPPPDEPYNLLTNGDFLRGGEGWIVPGEPISYVAGPGGAFTKAIRIEVTPEDPTRPWEISLRQPIGGRLKKDQPIMVRAWMRAANSNKVGIFIEESRSPYEKTLGGSITLTPQWKEYELKGVSKGDYGSEATSLVMHLGYAAGGIEIAGVRVFDPSAPPDRGKSGATPEKPVALLTGGDFAAPLPGVWRWNDKLPIKAEIVPAKVAGFERALRLTLDPGPESQPWTIQFGQRIMKTVSRDDAVYMRVWMRSPESTRVQLNFEMVGPPNVKSIAQTVKLSPEWKEYRFAAYSRATYAPDESQMTFFLGSSKGTIEVAGLRLENHGKASIAKFEQTIDYWGGAKPDDSWRAAALARIEKIRKGDLKVRVVDASGKPVPGAAVAIDQTDSFFRWGTAGPVRRLLDANNPESARYRAEVKRLYNTFTFESDLKWPNGVGNPKLLDQIEQGIDWLHGNGVANVRGHCLIWGSNKYTPPQIQSLSGEPLRDALRAHVNDYATRFKGKVYVWDVVNEAATNTEVWERAGWPAFAEAYKWTRAADPGVLLSYNDYNISNEAPDGGAQRKKVFERIQYLIDNGAPLDIVGDQAHISAPLTPIKRVLEIWDDLAKFGKPIEITEFDLRIPDDKMHGEYVRDYMIAAFSHPKIEAFVQWGFWEGQHWLANEGGAMFRRDWSKRPAQIAYEDLVLKQWRTHAKGKTAAGGSLDARAFYGSHTITVEKNGRKAVREVNLVPDGKNEITVELK